MNLSLMSSMPLASRPSATLPLAAAVKLLGQVGRRGRHPDPAQRIGEHGEDDRFTVNKNAIAVENDHRPPHSSG